jgi:hypothetical protein
LLSELSAGACSPAQRRFAFALNGDLEGTEENPELLEGTVVPLPLQLSQFPSISFPFRARCAMLRLGESDCAVVMAAFEVQCDMNKSTPLMVICSVGGELESDDNNKPYGVRSRSLITAHRLVRAGFDQVFLLHLTM